MEFHPVKSIAQFLDDANRIMSLAYKPGNDEFKRTLKIVLFFVLILGAMGYIISIIVGLIV
jgi:protein translocase SEC61 complex gamma subunit